MTAPKGDLKIGLMRSGVFTHRYYLSFEISFKTQEEAESYYEKAIESASQGHLKIEMEVEKLETK